MLSGKNTIQNINLTQTSESTATIVSTTEMKNYLKVDYDTDDDLIDILLLSSQKIIEQQLNMPVVECDYTQTQQGNCEYIDLLKMPVNGVPTVSYYESFDTVTATNITYSDYFRVVNNRLYHVDSWWNEGRQGDGYTINFKAGMYTTATYTGASVGLKEVSMRLTAYMYENREEGTSNIKENNWQVNYDWSKDPVGVKYLLMAYHKGYGII